MTRIGVDARTFSYPDPGGAVRYGIQLTKQLQRFHSDLKIFGHHKSTARLDDSSIDSYGYSSTAKWYGLLWEQTFLPKRASSSGVDILYSPNAYCPLIPTSFPCAITIHDVSSFKGHSAGWYNTFEQAILPQMVRRADIIFTVSEFSKSELCSELDIPPSKVNVVPNGVDKLFTSNQNLNSSLSLPESYILYVGSLSTRKNISGILNAFRILKKEYDVNHDLVLIGPEDDPTNESDISPGLIEPVQEDIVQLGYVSNKELKEAYTSADVFAFPSFYEGFGLPPLEAMACGTPVVASDRAAIPEILGDAALYINPNDPESIADGLYRILANPDLRDELLHKGYNQAEKYSWKQSVNVLRQKLLNVS